MRALLAASVLLAGCWSRDDFRSQCILAGNCQLDPVEMEVDAGLEIESWAEAATFLFGGLDGGDSSFDVSFVSNLTAKTSTGCGFQGGVLTTFGSVMCIPTESERALEFFPDGGVVPVTIQPPAGWAGGVLLADGSVLGVPTSASSALLLPRPKPPFPNRNPDYLPLGMSGPAPFSGAAVTADGTVVCATTSSAAFLRADGGTRQAAGAGEYAGAVLTESGRSVLLVPRTALRVVEATPRTLTTSDRVTQRGTGDFSKLAGGLLLESGDALLTPAVAGDVFVRVPFDGGAPVNVTSAVSRVSLFSAAWSTNGYAYGLDVDGGSPQVAVIDRRGNVTWQQLPASALDAGLFGPLSHIGLTAMADGRLISCGCRSSSAMILTPRTRRTVPVEVMSSPWLNKW
ncbi:MAG: hypothetical protein ABTQ32_24555 [Myxococcaceae bacterium]